MRRNMNNNFMIDPFHRFIDINNNQFNYEKIINKIDRLEKNIRILENRINILEKKEKQFSNNDEPTDMYMI